MGEGGVNQESFEGTVRQQGRELLAEVAGSLLESISLYGRLETDHSKNTTRADRKRSGGTTDEPVFEDARCNGGVRTGPLFRSERE